MLIMTTTLTATSMSTAEQRLRLMQLASSNLPVGGYSWSQGLEWAVEALAATPDDGRLFYR